MIPSTDLSWAKLVYGGVVAPGLCSIPDAPSEVEWDVQTSKGKKGATTTMKSERKPREFTANFELTDDNDNADQKAWIEFQALIESTVQGGKITALSVYHPSLSLAQMGPCSKKSVGLLIPQPGGKLTVSVKFQEYYPPSPSGTGPAKPGNPGAGYVGGAPKNDPLAAAIAENAKLQAQADKT